MKTIFNKPLIIVLTLSLLNTSVLLGQTESLNQIGTSMANFLKIGVGARASSMGDAFVALSDDITCLYWNPGGLGRLEKNSVIFQTTDWILDSRLSFVGISYKLSSKGVFGLSMYSFSSGEIQETTLSYPDGTGNTFSTANSCFGLTYSRQITDRFSAGLSLKYVTEQLYLEKANTVAMDVGSLFVTNFLNNMRIGFSLSNLGGRMQLEGASLGIKYTPGIKTYPAQLSTEPWDIPLLFRFGLATDILNTNIIRMTVSTEVMDSRDFIHRISTGTELAFNETVFLRGGYKYNYDETKLTLGAGVKTSLVAGLEMSADYSYGDFGVFSKYQRFSVIIGF